LKVKYDVSNVKHATGAVIEISATGTQFGLANPFNNPNGTVIDANGRDTGSIQQITVAGTTGSITLNTVGTGSVHLTPAMAHVVRVIPLDGNVPVAEAGDVSYVSMDGVIPADGGYLNFGFAANVNGNDGFLTSEQYDANGNQLNSVESFRQSDNTIVSSAIESGTSDDYFVNGSGIFGNDTGLFGDGILSPPYSISFSLLNPTSGAVGSTIGIPNWQPSPIFANFAPDSTTTTPALFHMPFAYRLNLLTGTYSAPLDLSQYAQSSGNDAYNSFAANNATGDVFTEFFSLNYSPTCQPGQILYGNLNTGTAGTFPGPGFDFFQVGAIAVDSTSNKAAVFSACNGALAVIDLNSHTTSSLTAIPGMAGFLSSGVLYTTIDEAHRLVFVHSAYSPDWGVNNNSLSSVFTFDESGHYLGANENFFFYNTFFLAQANFLTVNPSTRTGYDFGPLQTQLEPFSY
jgi:hypothetical protein